VLAIRGRAGQYIAYFGLQRESERISAKAGHYPGIIAVKRVKVSAFVNKCQLFRKSVSHSQKVSAILRKCQLNAKRWAEMKINAKRWA
jgi:hypothetical protein